jgi:8-oxo-dGTP diphosphatase
MRSSKAGPVASCTPIRIAAALIADQNGRILLVRKRHTRCFMQPGGKLEDRETPTESLARELVEELGCTLVQADFLGIFTAPAANEPGRAVEALLFSVKITGDVQPTGEIEEVTWVEPSRTNDLTLAPLTRDYVLPLVLPNAS